MNITNLLKSTSYVRGYGARDTFNNKQFGAIYLYNKNIRVKPNSSIIEISMMIKGVTEMTRPTKNSQPRPVAAHKAMIAVRGVNQEVVTEETLIERIRKVEPYNDAKAYPKSLIRKLILDEEVKFFEDKTIFKNSGGGYVIVDDNVSKESEIRVWCSCSSYYWVFQYYNVENGVDIWMKYPDQYIPKTKKGYEAFRENRPVRNPGRHPGMCKHLMLLLALLMYTDESSKDSNVLAEARSIVRSYKANFSKFKKLSRLSPDQYKKLMKSYQKDHKGKLLQRQLERSTSGYAGQKESKSGWNRKFDWRSGTWKKRR